ncbi:PhoH-like protein [Rickettsiales bacterium Ac37b]|nr:PhoH-like protein [Rickettsiales bacterium Ac37b]
MATFINNHLAYITFDNNSLLSELFGTDDSYLRYIEQKLKVTITVRGNKLSISGFAKQTDFAKFVLETLYKQLKQTKSLDIKDFESTIELARANQMNISTDSIYIKTPKRVISPYSYNQSQYLCALKNQEIVFATGPAGTGKTYLAVAHAVHMFLTKQVERIILTRPAVEAGEKLGFLPGDIKEKIDPYLQPLYDALLDMINADLLAKYMDNGEIELAPLAFMRGRTLNNAYIILDEAQNTTTIQMKMFLTRLGKYSRMVITGDPSQGDLLGQKSGLVDAINKLSSIPEIGFILLNEKDIIRNPLIIKIIQAYNQ